jgi:hypothetical protein
VVGSLSVLGRFLFSWGSVVTNHQGRSLNGVGGSKLMVYTPEVLLYMPLWDCTTPVSVFRALCDVLTA